MNLLFLTPSITDSCSFYRSGGVIADLQKKLDAQIKFAQWDKVYLHWQEFSRFDLVMMQRPFDGNALSVSKYLKDLKIPLWVDYDDNLMALGRDNDKYLLYNAETRENIKQIVVNATVVTVATKELSKVFGQLNSNTVVIPNAFPDTVIKGRELKLGRSKMVLWRGSSSHIKDVWVYAHEIEEAMREFKDYQFVFMGFDPWFFGPANNYFNQPPMDVVHYFTQVQKMAPFLLHVPLFDSPFNRSKSNIAWIEGSYFGSICLVPEWEEWCVPGVVTYNNASSYLRGLQMILKGEVDVVKQANISWSYIQDNLMLSKVNNERVNVIKSLL